VSLPFTLESFPTREAWLAGRAGIGSSDAPSCMGEGFLTPIELWGQKTGKLPASEDSMRFRFGHYAEAFIHQETEPQLGTKLLDPGDFTIFRSRELPQAFATSDRLVLRPGLELPQAPAPALRALRAFRQRAVIGPMSLKTVKAAALRFWPEGKPSRYGHLQIQHELYVLGLEEAWFTALVGAGEDLLLYHVTRDPELLEQLLEAEYRMLRCIETDTPPDPDDDERTARALNLIFAQHEAGKVVVLENAGVMLLRWRKIKRLQKKLKTIRTGIENQFKVGLGEAWKAEIEDLPGAAISWRTQPGQKKLPVRERTLAFLREVHPDLADELTYKQGTTRVLREESDEEDDDGRD